MNCNWCKDTGKVKLLFSEVECTECNRIIKKRIPVSIKTNFQLGDVINHEVKEIWQSLPDGTLLHLKMKKYYDQWILINHSPKHEKLIKNISLNDPIIKQILDPIIEMQTKHKEFLEKIGYIIKENETEYEPYSACVGSYRVAHSGVAQGGAYPWRNIEKNNIVSAKIIKFDVIDNKTNVAREIKNYVKNILGTAFNPQTDLFCIELP